MKPQAAVAMKDIVQLRIVKYLINKLPIIHWRQPEYARIRIQFDAVIKAAEKVVSAGSRNMNKYGCVQI